ncbi:hypothetical protein AURDEDRAFT_131687 [Auricularia subglabra TFB-10046 SS5]|nr:hypothetical protein AURDEDRAFT_131687 [Auricularia subglabra TFB-10046 SS5]
MLDKAKPTEYTLLAAPPLLLLRNLADLPLADRHGLQPPGAWGSYAMGGIQPAPTLRPLPVDELQVIHNHPRARSMSVVVHPSYLPPVYLSAIDSSLCCYMCTTACGAKITPGGSGCLDENLLSHISALGVPTLSLRTAQSAICGVRPKRPNTFLEPVLSYKSAGSLHAAT